MKKMMGYMVTFGHKAGTRAIKQCQRILGVSTLGARAIVVDERGFVLLVKHTYQRDWYLPGGGVKPNESVLAAIARELKEEVGIIITETPTLFGVYYHKYLGVSDYPIIFVVKKFRIEPVSCAEIEQAEWFDFHRLPETVAPGTRRRLNEYFLKTQQIEHW